MSHEHCTATAQSRAAAHAKLKKLMHKEPAVRVLLAERDALAARVDELEAQLAQPAVIKGDAGEVIEAPAPKSTPAKKGK